MTVRTYVRPLACVASVFVGFSARLRYFLLFGGAKNWGERNTYGREGEGRREKETLAQKQHDFEKHPFDTFAVG